MIRFFIAFSLIVAATACGDIEPKPNTIPTNGNNASMTDAGVSDGGTDPGTDGGNQCENDSQCEPGTVCSPNNECIAASCEFCTADQICYVSDDNPDGTCSSNGSTPPGEDPVPCVFDTDCPLGTVCGAEETCILASCEFCAGDQVCYVRDEYPQGTCSALECISDADCVAGDLCIDGFCQ